MRSIGWFITRIAAKLGVGVTPIRPVDHGVDLQLSLARPVYPVGDGVI